MLLHARPPPSQSPPLYAQSANNFTKSQDSCREETLNASFYARSVYYKHIDIVLQGLKFRNGHTKSFFDLLPPFAPDI